MNKLNELPNIGEVLEQNLIKAGINTPEQLRKMGAIEAFIRIRAFDPSACIHMLYGIQGAVDGVKDSALSVDKKQELKEFFRSLK